MEQRSKEWFEARLGKFTSSSIHKIMKSGRGKDEYFGQTALSYIGKNAAELLTGTMEEFGSKQTDWGEKWEPHARARYEMETKQQVIEAGFIQDPKFEYAGGSPDGLVGPFGQIEIKCPYNSDIHLKYLKIDSYKDFEQAVKDAGYHWQVQNNMRVLNSEWCDFVSYDPRYDWKQQIKIFRIEKNEDMWRELEERIEAATEILLDLKYSVG